MYNSSAPKICLDDGTFKFMQMFRKYVYENAALHTLSIKITRV